MGRIGYIGIFALAAITWGLANLLAPNSDSPPTPFAIGLVVVGVTIVLAKIFRQHHKQKQKEDRLRQIEVEGRKKREQREEQRKREEQERAEQIEALLERDALRESVHYMDGGEFENFMANVLAQKGYQVQTTPKSGDQGVDLLLTINERNVAVQLKRYTGAVGNAAVQAVVAGMFHYKAKEAWVITTSTFTKSAKQLAMSNRVRLVDGKELEDWLCDLRDEA